jgi:Lon protease-like protein
MMTKDRIPIFAHHTLLLPHTDLGIHVYDQPYRELVAHSLGNGHSFGVVLDGSDVGTLARIGGYARLPDGRYLLELEGTKRFRTTELKRGGAYPLARVQWLHEHIGNFARARTASDDVAALFQTYRMYRGDGDLPVHLPVDPITRSFVVASQLRVDVAVKQQLLECDAADERLEAEVGILHHEIELLEGLRSTRA